MKVHLKQWNNLEGNIQIDISQDTDKDDFSNKIAKTKRGQSVKSRKRKAETKPERCYKNYTDFSCIFHFLVFINIYVF